MALQKRRPRKPKLEKYCGALNVAIRAVQNEQLKLDLQELKDHIEKNSLCWTVSGITLKKELND